MQLLYVREHRSIKNGSVQGVELPEFVVLTGPNGSGKSNLLEGLSLGALVVDDLGALQPPAVRLFSPGQLVATAEAAVQPSSVREPWADLFNNVQSWKQQAPVATSGNSLAQEAWVRSTAVGSRSISEPALERMVKRSGKSLIEMTASDYTRYAPLTKGIRSPFEQSLVELFLTYSQRDFVNQVAGYTYSQRGGTPSLTAGEFVESYGEAPWALLNTILKVVGLTTYRFESPPDGMENINYEVFLRDEHGAQIRPSELSSGERVLLALATSLHTGTSQNSSVEFPKLLLLDEPDASLHPSMSKSMLTVLEEIFVKQYGVRVLMSTHSATTVALAPEASLFVMSRATPRLSKATADEALNYLTVGISSLSVKLENRRQVFVESEYDQSVYQELYTLLKPKLSLDRSIEFIAAGKRDKGGGCDAVKRLVGELRASGVSTVHGVIDRDKRSGAGDNIHFIADRYSIENLILDPLLVTVFLLREGHVASETLGLPAATRHFQIEPKDGQGLVNWLAVELGFAGISIQCGYVGGFHLSIPVEFLETQGHQLEEALTTHFPPLKAYRGGLKEKVVELAAADFPSFIPVVLLDLLIQIVAN